MIGAKLAATISRPTFAAKLLAASLGACLWVCLGAGPVGAANETLIGFDDLSSGTVVANQYQAQGLELGQATSFGQASPGEGDCGSPSVGGDATYQPPSPPNYAVLAKCKTVGAPNSSGTYGALLDHPHGPFSVELRDLTPSPGPAAVKVTLYDEHGAEVGHEEGSATQGSWTTVKVPNAGGAKIGYFAIATTKPTEDTIAIDNLSFETATEEGGGKEKSKEEGGGKEEGKEVGGAGKVGGSGGTQTGPGGGSGGTPNPGPSASLALTTPNPHKGEALTLSGVASRAGSGQIVSYDWDFNNDGKIDTSTGANPVAQVILPPGNHTIALTVTNSSGQSSTSRLGVAIPSVGVQITIPDGGEGSCESSLTVGSAQILAECIQTVSGGYVIESKQLDLNGMVLAPKSGGLGVFKIAKHRQFGIGTKMEMSGPPVNVELLNTPIGDVVLGGYDLEKEPIELAFQSELINNPIKLGSNFVAPRAHAAGESKGLLLMSLGVGHECEPGGKKEVGCCPQSKGTTACATLPGNFPLTGQIQVYLNNKAQVLFEVQVGLNLHEVGFEATGELEIVTGLETGVDLSSLKFEIPEASLASVFKVKDASFVYYFPSDPDASKRDSWQAKAGITFAAIEEAGIEGELSFKKGQFHSASLVLTLPPGAGITLYPGIELNKFGGSIAVEPFAFGGTLGAAIATQLELTLEFRYAEPFEGKLGYFGGKGSLTLDKDEIATLAADVYSDGYVDAQLKIDLQLPFESKDPIVQVGGGIGFWDEPSSGLWEASGNVFVKIWIINAEVAGLIDNKYVAACGNIDGAGAYDDYNFQESKLDGPGFFLLSNCSDQLKKFKEMPLVEHKGGFVGEEALFGAGTPGGSFGPGGGLLGAGAPYAGLRSAHASATGSGAAFSLPSGQPGEELRIVSSSGTPVVTFTGPSGQTFTTPVAPGKAEASSAYIAALGNSPDEAIVLLRHPQGGTWHLKEAPGSAPVSEVQGAQDLPPATVRAIARRGRGQDWKLSYKIAHYLPGTHVTFVEHGHDSTHVLGTVGKAKGTLSFVPQPGLSRPRTITAAFTNTAGVKVRVFTVGHYTAPAVPRPPRPKHVRILRHGSTATVTWSAAPGARYYRIKVKGSDGRLDTFFARPGHLSKQLVGVIPADSFKATVIAVGGPSMLPGPAATASLKAVKAPKPAPIGKRRHRSRGA